MNREIINKTENYVKEKFLGEGTGHDWWHIHRVRNLAIEIGKKENAKLFIIELAALLHDIGDHKLHNGVDKSRELISDWLSNFEINNEDTNHIIHIVENVSYKGAKVKSVEMSIEGQIVQDADRLDAIGAVGIARTFAYGGSKGREIHNPEIQPKIHQSFNEYKKSTAPTINHFYEKLLLLKDRMNTKAAKQIAEKRHLFMVEYLERFFKEWEGEE